MTAFIVEILQDTPLGQYSWEAGDLVERRMEELYGELTNWQGVQDVVFDPIEVQRSGWSIRVKTHSAPKAREALMIAVNSGLGWGRFSAQILADR